MQLLVVQYPERSSRRSKGPDSGRSFLGPTQRNPCRFQTWLSCLLPNVASGYVNDQRDEIATLHHSITSSATASSLTGISRPSALAVTRLKTSSNLVGCSTGRPPGLVPRMILST